VPLPQRLWCHPPAELLEAFERGDLPAEDIAEVEEHLLDCADCCDALAALPADAFTARLRDVRLDSRPDTPGAATPPPTVEFTCLAVASPSAPPPGTPALAGFEDVRELGRGGMGVVYAATHAVMGRRVAVKLIHPEYAASAAAVERFRREARAVARLTHPNLVTAYDAGQDGDRPFLVMEYLDGESLADRLERDGPLPIAEACDCVRQAARGLQFAHDNGLVHRDVKPHNLMLVASPDASAPGVVKVLDFGLAALANDGGRTAGQTGPNAVMGTPDYMAPEQAEDARSADGRADVYGLGCTLFHLLTGKVPFPMDSTLLKLLAHRTQERPSARAARREVPAALDAVLAKAMARRPDERYPTPGALADALEPFADPDCVARLARRKRRRTLAALAVLFLAVATVAAGVVRLPVGKDRVIVIETDDAEVEVIVKGDRIVRIVDPKTGRAYRLDREELTLSMVDEPDGLAVTLDGKNPIVLKRQGKRIGTVRLEKRTVVTGEAQPGHPFNGKDLDGWVMDGGAPGAWRVENGEIVGKSNGEPNSFSYLLTEKSYSDFRLRFEFRLDAGANSGVALRAIPGADRHPDWPAVPEPVEVQILDDGFYRKPDGRYPNPTGSLYWASGKPSLDPDRRADLKLVGHWNEMVIESRGALLQVWVNGHKVQHLDLDTLARSPGAKPGLKRASGRIGFQQHTGEVRFRNIEINELPAPEKSVGKEHGRLFNGRDLTGWSVDRGPPGVWRVEDSELVLTHREKAYGRLLTERSFADFRMSFEYRLSAGADCAVVLRAVPGELSDDRPSAPAYLHVETQDDESDLKIDGVDSPTGTLHTSENSSYYRPNRPADLKPVGSWNEMVIESRGAWFQVWVNGRRILNQDLDGAGLRRSSGRIGFQQRTGEVRFRNIEIKELTPAKEVGEKRDRHFFNGEDLTGCVGLPGYWHVEGGALVGTTRWRGAAHTFLVSEKKYRDFDLKFQARRLDGVGNSGVQFRSRIADLEKYTVVGPQCEIDSADHSFPPGSLITEPDLKPLAQRAPRAAVAAKYRNDGFNDFHIRCVGKHVTIKVNGVLAIDDDYPEVPDEGVIAWQLNGYSPPREVAFRNIEFTDLSAPFKPLTVERNLFGWILEGNEERFQSNGEVLTATSPHWKSRGYLLSEKEYENYRLRFDCRVEEGANGGVVVRGDRADRSTFEANGAIDHPVIKFADRFHHPNMSPGASHWVASGKHEGPSPRVVDFPIGQWNAVEMEVKGATCQVWVNKALVITLELDAENKYGQLLAGLARTKGHIGFQANTGTVRFRNIEIAELPPSAR
jgi:tRNA A-37 threonylcarbamoyl transferase component Bud32